ncbi:MAG: hypothetical protein WCD33_02230 [Mycobacterium sp.]|uniref:hypothetical protein n=1 Tax=Mycobacterium sp. TaxID=1785 RepID=UPI003C7147F6
MIRHRVVHAKQEGNKSHPEGEQTNPDPSEDQIVKREMHGGQRRADQGEGGEEGDYTDDTTQDEPGPLRPLPWDEEDHSGN